jgi:hypothetical protein
MFQLTSVPELANVVLKFFSSIVVLTPNGKFWFIPLQHSVSDFKPFCAIQLETDVPFHKLVSVTTDRASAMFNKQLA